LNRFDLGGHKRPVTTNSKEAQEYFDLGLNWCFGFNQEEGVKCFQKALDFDPDCAMAYWGVAFAAGPFYNFPWCDFSEDEAIACTRLCYENVHHALSLINTCSASEAALIRALAQRFQKPHPVSQQEFDTWDDAYGNAMREVYHSFPDDLDVTALFVEAIITRTPWKLWNVKTNEPAQGADTLEALEACEKAIAQVDAKEGTTDMDHHPAILHLHIHVTEMSKTPERAMRSADMLGALCPDAGHLNHMPGHTYVLCGEYEKAKIASEKAIAADEMYVDYAGPFNFYTTARCHDLHLMMYTCMFLGQIEPALKAAEQICQTLTKEVLEVKGRPQLAITMEGYYAMRMHVLVRFGKWQDIADTPMPPCPELYCVSTAMHHYAKGVAHAALKNFPAAENERMQFHSSLKRIPANRKFFNNSALTILAVGEKMLDGELEYHKGNYTEAYEHLRQSVARDDELEYSEPWAWMHPPRHALAALLMEQGHYEEAETVYRTDLGLIGLGLNDELQRCAQHPNNVWALHGLVECLSKRNETNELAIYKELLKIALEKTDVPITSSCLCRTKTVNLT